MIHRGYSISFNKLKKYILGYLVNDAFFFFKVKYIETKNAVLWGYIGQFIFGFLQYYRFYKVALSKLSGSFNVIQ